MGPLSAAERAELLTRSPLAGQYDTVNDRDSAYEELTRRTKQRQQELAESVDEASRSSGKKSSRGDSAGLAFLKSAARSFGTQLGRHLVRGLLGALSGKR